MQILFRVLVVVTFVAVSCQKDEENPYEFGFTIDGQQHRHEKKDAKGIIQGEYGFITADGIYHTTVYATDENGSFRILSMRSVRISAPLDGSPLPPGAKIEGNPQPGQAVAKVEPLKQPTQIQTQPQAPVPPPQATKAPNAPYAFTTQPTLKPGCSSCGIPVSTTAKPAKFQFQTPEFQQPGGNVQPQDRLGPIAHNYPQSNISPPINPGPAVINKSPTNPQDNLPPFTSSNNGADINVQPQDRLGPITNNYPQNNVNPPLAANPGPAVIDNAPTYPQDNLPPLTSSNNGAGVNGHFNYDYPQETVNPVPNPGDGGGNNNYRPTQVQAVNYPSQPINAPDLSPIQQNLPVAPPNLETVPPPPHPQISDVGVNVQKAPSILDRAQVSDGAIHIPGKSDIPIQDKFPGMTDGLPEGVSEKDVTDILYKFHYEVGFHGHYEKGLKNGAKIGGYFVNGRDGISRIVTYIADENGYRPKVKFIRLDADKTPNEATEKTFGLKSFEFVWYPVE